MQCEQLSEFHPFPTGCWFSSEQHSVQCVRQGEGSAGATHSTYQVDLITVIKRWPPPLMGFHCSLYSVFIGTDLSEQGSAAPTDPAVTASREAGGGRGDPRVRHGEPPEGQGAVDRGQRLSRGLAPLEAVMEFILVQKEEEGPGALVSGRTGTVQLGDNTRMPVSPGDRGRTGSVQLGDNTRMPVSPGDHLYSAGVDRSAQHNACTAVKRKHVCF